MYVYMSIHRKTESNKSRLTLELRLDNILCIRVRVKLMIEAVFLKMILAGSEY